MLAIPIFRARVAPVLDWCSKIVVIPKDGSDAASGRLLDVTEGNAFKLVQVLREQGINTLICGALSPELLKYGESIGLNIIHGVAGEIEEVLSAYRKQKLDQPRYRLPGCCAHRRYKTGTPCPCNEQDAGIDGRRQPGSAGTGQPGKRKGALRPEGL